MGWGVKLGRGGDAEADAKAAASNNPGHRRGRSRGNDTPIGRQGADTYIGGAADWFTTTGVDRFSVRALGHQAGVVVTIAGLGFGLTGGGVFIENFPAAQFHNQLLTPQRTRRRGCAYGAGSITSSPNIPLQLSPIDF